MTMFNIYVTNYIKEEDSDGLEDSTRSLHSTKQLFQLGILFLRCELLECEAHGGIGMNAAGDVAAPRIANITMTHLAPLTTWGCIPLYPWIQEYVECV